MSHSSQLSPSHPHVYFLTPHPFHFILSHLLSSSPTHFVYQGMMPGILEMFEGVCAKKGINWPEKLKHWKEEGQWHVEVY